MKMVRMCICCKGCWLVPLPPAPQVGSDWLEQQQLQATGLLANICRPCWTGADVTQQDAWVRQDKILEQFEPTGAKLPTFFERYQVGLPAALRQAL